jgi:hypothetical protein
MCAPSKAVSDTDTSAGQNSSVTSYPADGLVVVEARPTRLTVICDVSQITEPDERALEALARLQLTARRLGVSIRLHNAGSALVDLVALVGLSDVLVCGESGVEVDRQVEQREEIGVDEEVHRGDDAG